MSKSYKGSGARPKPSSAVDPDMLGQYRRAARTADAREDVGALVRLTDEYGILAKSGDNLRAMGAAMEFIDVVLRIAATPSPTDRHREYKRGFFERYLPSMAETIHHPHVARLANAALTAEIAMAAGGSDVRH